MITHGEAGRNPAKKMLLREKIRLTGFGIRITKNYNLKTGVTEMIDRDTSLSLQINGRTTLTMNGVDAGKVARIRDSLATNGWQGRPVIMVDCGDHVIALTGSHRLAAAHDLGLTVPVVWMPELNSDQWDALNEYCDDMDRLRIFEALADVDGMADVIDVQRAEIYA